MQSQTQHYRNCTNAVNRYLPYLGEKGTYSSELYRKSDVISINRDTRVGQAILFAKSQGF